MEGQFSNILSTAVNQLIYQIGSETFSDDELSSRWPKSLINAPVIDNRMHPITINNDARTATGSAPQYLSPSFIAAVSETATASSAPPSPIRRRGSACRFRHSTCGTCRPRGDSYYRSDSRILRPHGTPYAPRD